jgi:transposase-like protein
MLEFELGPIHKGDFRMAKKRFQAEQIIGKLREAEVEISKGQTIAQIAKKLGITEQTYYRWRKEYGGLRSDQAKRLKEQDKQIARLKKVVANQALDMEILREAASGNF